MAGLKKHSKKATFPENMDDEKKHVIEFEAKEAIDAETAAQKKENVLFLEVECPNCRANPGEPCIWDNGDVCESRKRFYQKQRG
jgi:hypothetical protein